MTVKAQKLTWKQDPDAVRADIIGIAKSAFAENGLAGARIDEIAARTRASKRMIYYYFGDKAGLYRAVLEATYAEMRRGEDALELTGLEPVAALRRLAEFTFDHHAENPEFIRLVMVENIHGGAYLRGSEAIRGLNVSAIEKLEEICARGKADGVFRDDADPLLLHWQISAGCFFNVSNRATFSLIFDTTLDTGGGQAALRRHLSESVVRAVLR